MGFNREFIDVGIKEYSDQFGLSPKLRDCLTYLCLGYHVDDIAGFHADFFEYRSELNVRTSPSCVVSELNISLLQIL